MSSPAAEVRLLRSPLARLFSGGNFQWFLSVVLILEIALVGFVASLVGPVVLLRSLPGLIVFLPWLLGVTAWARADADGVHWRYYRRQSFSWSEIEQVELGSARRAGAAAGVAVPAVRVRGGGRSHPLGPSVGVGAPRLQAFARELGALARLHGVATTVTSPGGYWDAFRD